MEVFFASISMGTAAALSVLLALTLLDKDDDDFDCF